MVPNKTYFLPGLIAVCLLFGNTGCTPGPGEPGAKKLFPEQLTLALKFAPGQTAKYRAAAEAKKGLEFEGSLADDPAFKGGQTGTRIEMVFTQEIEQVQDNGRALAKVTINELKFHDISKNKVLLDFDSSEEKDNPLAKLIGQSYTIEIDPAGQVSRVVEVAQARAALGGRVTGYRRAALLDNDAIMERHTIAALPDKTEQSARPGDDWSRIKTMPFGLMGTKVYERIYVLKGVKAKGGRHIATIEMNAIPTAEQAEQLHKEQPDNPFSKMFDSIDKYTGSLTFDMTSGAVREYVEELKSEWLIVDPAAQPDSEKIPDALRMSALRLHSLERLD